MHNSKKIVVGTSKGTLVTLQISDYLEGNLMEKTLPQFKKVHEHSINSMRVSRSGTWLLTGEKNGIVKYFRTSINFENQEVKTRTVTALLKQTDQDPLKHEEPIRDIAVAASEEKFVTCSDDKTIRLVDFDTARIEGVFQGHGSDVTTVDWHPYLSLIASGAKDRIIKLWDPKGGVEICSMYNHTNSISKIRFSDDGKYMLTCGKDQMIKLFDVRSMKVVQNYKGHGSDILSIAWNSAIPNIFASSDQLGDICVWDTNSSKPLSVMNHSKDPVWEVAWNQLGTIIASCGGDRNIKLWAPGSYSKLQS